MTSYDIIICIYGCITIEKYKKQIEKINETWFKKAKTYPTIKCIYFLGEDTTTNIINKDDDTYVYLEGVGNDYLSASYKQFIGLEYIFKNYISKYVLCCGTDTYINIPKLVEYLEKFDSKESLYIGGHGCHRNLGESIYYHSGGPGVILSWPALSQLSVYLPTIMQEWIEICNKYSQFELIPACDVAISYFFKKKNMDIKIIIDNSVFFHCNYKGFPCHKWQPDISKIIGCHLMSLEDFDNFTDILYKNNYFMQTVKNISSVLLLSHNGLGDNITMIGAVKYLTTIYDKVYLICKKHNQKNIDDLLDSSNVITVPIIGSQYQEEYNECRQILEKISESTDILISGRCHTSNFKSRITNKELIEYRLKNNNTEYSCDYSFIRDFYYDICLDLKIYYDWFDIPSSPLSIQHYESIKNKKIIFLHTKASDKEINLDKIINKYITDESYLIICPNKNMYESSNVIKSNNESIAATYINLPIRDYIDIIKKAIIIHTVNSCFSCVVYPLVKSGKITPIEWKIYERNEDII
jgi:hypothetical protein